MSAEVMSQHRASDQMSALPLASHHASREDTAWRSKQVSLADIGGKSETA